MKKFGIVFLIFPLIFALWSSLKPSIFLLPVPVNSEVLLFNTPPARSYHVAIFGDYTENQRKMVEKSVKDWNNLAGRTFLSFTEGEGDIVIEFHTFEYGAAVGVAIPGNSYCPILIQPEVTNYRVVAHEIGHCIGFGHSEEFLEEGPSRSLMGAYLLPWVFRGSQYTSEIKRLVQKLYGVK